MRTTNTIVAIAVLTALGACNDTANRPSESPSNSDGATNRPVSDAVAELALGEAHYRLDFTTCVDEESGAVWISASDEQTRAAFPSIRIRYFPDRTVKPPVFSVEFLRADPRVLWRLESGTIQPTTTGHEATGIMNATEMTDDEQGRRMLPMDASNNRAFVLKVRC